MNANDASVIPSGNYCYQLHPIAEGEVLSMEVERYGKDLREFPYHRGVKQVACPYFQRTDYGTILCNYLDLEVRDDRELINAHFNDEDAADRFPLSWDLSDEIKVCGINMDDDDGYLPMFMIENLPGDHA